MKSSMLSPIRDCSAFQPIFKAAASIAALLLLNMGGVASEGPIRLATVTADAPGKILQNSMIWVPDTPVFRGMPAAFRKVFQLAKAPREAKLRMFADSRYILWINGTYVGRGPNRFHIGGPEYDTYNVAGHLKVGENLVAVFAFSTPSGGFWRAMNHDPGFGAVLETDGTVAWTTRDGWTCSTKTRFDKLIGTGDHIEDGVVDVRRECGDWWLPSFSALDWQKPVPVNGTSWGPLSASRIPHLRERELPVVLPKGIVLPATLKAGEKLSMTTDGITLGYLRLEVDATDGAELKLPGLGRSRYEKGSKRGRS